MQLFFNLLTAILIMITALPAVILFYSLKKRINSWEYKHKKNTYLLITILLISLLLVLYGSFVEPLFLNVNKQQITISGINQPLKIAFISDLHVGKYQQTRDIQKIVNKILELKPDLVFLGGDQVDNEVYAPEEFDYLKPLQDLTREISVYAINGNHEYGVNCFYGINQKCSNNGSVAPEAKKQLTRLGIKYLVNDLEKITVNSSSFYLFGGDEYWSKKLDWAPLIKNRKENLPIIALIHNPAVIFETIPKEVHLILSGHTHGGQIRLPFIGSLALVDSQLPREYYLGLHDVNSSTKIFVTSGAGQTGTRARLFNPREIVLLTIKGN